MVLQVELVPIYDRTGRMAERGSKLLEDIRSLESLSHDCVYLQSKTTLVYRLQDRYIQIMNIGNVHSNVAVEDSGNP